MALARAQLADPGLLILDEGDLGRRSRDRSGPDPGAATARRGSDDDLDCSFDCRLPRSPTSSWCSTGAAWSMSAPTTTSSTGGRAFTTACIRPGWETPEQTGDPHPDPERPFPADHERAVSNERSPDPQTLSAPTVDRQHLASGYLICVLDPPPLIGGGGLARSQVSHPARELVESDVLVVEGNSQFVARPPSDCCW